MTDKFDEKTLVIERKYTGKIFYKYGKANGTLADMSGNSRAIDVTLSNCVYGASDGSLKYGTTVSWTDVGGSFLVK